VSNALPNDDRFDDIDLMQLADGELDEAESTALAARLDASTRAEADATSDAEPLAGAEDAQIKLAALDQMTDTVRSYLELAADDAEPALDAMWERIESRIGSRSEARAADAAPNETQAEAVFSDPAPREGLWARLVRWFDSHRGHFVTGAVTAGAVAALFLLLRQEPAERDPVAQAPTPITPTPVRPPPVPAPTIVASPPQVESLEVMTGSGTVFTIPGDDGDESNAAVILVTFDESDVEGPI